MAPCGVRRWTEMYNFPHSLPACHRLDHAEGNGPRAIKWTLFSQLEDLDFTDELAAALLILQHLHEKTDRLSTYAEKAGLKISFSKTQVMPINATPEAPITISER